MLPGFRLSQKLTQASAEQQRGPMRHVGPIQMAYAGIGWKTRAVMVRAMAIRNLLSSTGT
jgi:hypothetical protein